jgi:TonB family protein
MRRLRTFLALSLLVHVLFFALMSWQRLQTNIQPRKDQVEIVVLDPNDQQRLQLIEQDEKRANDEVPEDAKYMGRHNQRVIKETKAAQHGDFRNSSGQGLNAKPQQKPPTKARPKTPAPSATDDGGPSLAKLNPKFEMTHADQYKEIPHAGSGGPASATNDHLKDVAVGIETMLNSREFVYYTYYQRIRSQIRQHWEPSIRAKVKNLFTQGRSIASTRDHITRVVIVLDKNGDLIKVNVVGTSGVGEIDDAATEAFRAAEPFPNPPKGIVDTDGTIKINWDFILEA